MSAPLAPPSSSELEAILARNWALRVREVGGTEEDWVFVRALNSCQPIFEGAEQDASDIDGDGYGASIVTGLNWRVEGGFKRKGIRNAGVYSDDPGQALIRSKGRTKTGSENFLEFQIYRRDDAPDAFQGIGPVIYSDSAASDPNALSEATFTIKGNGAPVEITKPAADAVEKTFTVTGAPTGGTWTATVDGQTTGTLSRSISAAQFQSALEALSTVGEGNVVVTGDAVAGLVATFNVAVTTVTAAHTFTGGTTPGVTVA